MSASVIDRFSQMPAWSQCVRLGNAQCARTGGTRDSRQSTSKQQKYWTEQMLFVDATETRHGQLTIDPYIYAPF